MLSELGHVEPQLLGVRDWDDFKGLFQPGPEVSVCEEVHPKQCHQVGERPVELGAQLEPAQEQHGNQCCPDLNLDGIGAGADERLDLQILLEGLEEQLDLPAVFVDGGHRSGAELQVIREKDQGIAFDRIIKLNAAQWVRTPLQGIDPTQANGFILEDMTIAGHATLLDDVVDSIDQHPGDKVDVLACPTAKQGVIIVAPVVDNDGAGGELELTGDLNLRNFAFGDDCKAGKVTIVVQEKVKLHCPLGTAEEGPVKHLERQVDNRGIKAHQLVLEAELSLSQVDLTPATIKQVQKDKLEKLPRAMFISISQSRMTGGADAQMLQLTFTATQTSRDLSQGIRPSELTEQHADELAPGRETPGMALRFRLTDPFLELQARKQLQYLTEHATIPIQVEPSFGHLVSCRNIYTNSGLNFSIPFLKPNLDKSALGACLIKV